MDLKDLLLGIAAIFGPVLAYLAATRGQRIAAEAQLERTRIETKQKVDDSTGAHVLAAWKVTLEEVKVTRDEVRAERAALEASKRESALEREAAAHARQQSKLDNELATIAVNKNAQCEEQLEAIRERLTNVEAVHAECPARIAALERSSEARNVTIAELRKEISMARYALDQSERPPPL